MPAAGMSRLAVGDLGDEAVPASEGPSPAAPLAMPVFALPDSAALRRRRNFSATEGLVVTSAWPLSSSAWLHSML